MEVLHELLPKEAIIGVLMNPSGPGARTATKDLEDAARGIGRRLVVRTASRAEDLEPTFRAFRDDGATGILLIDDPFFGTQRGPIAILAENFRMPLIGSQRDWAVIGALMGYGPDLRDGYRQCGNYAGQILRGTKPADLPVVQAPRIALVINLKTAKALGVIVPPTLLARADEVIE